MYRVYVQMQLGKREGEGAGETGGQERKTGRNDSTLNSGDVRGPWMPGCLGAWVPGVPGVDLHSFRYRAYRHGDSELSSSISPLCA